MYKKWFTSALLSISFIAAAQEEVLLVDKKERNEEHSSSYIPSKEYWPAIAVFIAGDIGAKFISPNYYERRNLMRSCGRLTMPLAWLGGIIKHKRYAYLPASLVYILPTFLDVASQITLFANGDQRNEFTLLCAGINDDDYAFKGNHLAICCALFAAGYVYETYQEKKAKKKYMHAL